MGRLPLDRLCTPTFFIGLLVFSFAFPAGAKEDVPKNLVDNPSFDKEGEDPVPKWTLRRSARKARFRVEGGVLIAERTAAGGVAGDSCLQKVYLPEDTRALRVRIRASCLSVRNAEIIMRYADREGAALGRVPIFLLKGTFEMGWLERDLRLPAGASDAEIEFRMLAPGTLKVDEVVVHSLDPDRVRAVARIVVVQGAAVVSCEGKEEVVSLPVPPATETQSPTALLFESEPAGRIRAANLVRDDAGDVLALTIDQPKGLKQVKLFWSCRVVLTEIEGYGELPETIPVVPVRHLPRRHAKWGTESVARPVEELYGSLAKEGQDLLGLAAAIAANLARVAVEPGGPLSPGEAARARRGSATGRANLMAELFRAAGLPARPIALLATARGKPVFGAEVLTRDHGWLRFLPSADAARPLRCADHVLLARPAAPSAHALLAPRAGEGVTVGPGEVEGVHGGDAFFAKEVGTVVLDKGMGPALISSLAKAWERATRKVDPASGAARIPGKRFSLRGKVKKLAPRVSELIGTD